LFKIKYIHDLLFSDAHSRIEYDMLYWREQICNTVLYLFAVFGLFTYIPSVILSIREGYYSLVILSSILYLFCIFLTFVKRIGYKRRAVSISILYYIVGLFLIFMLGPRGAGEVWLFTATILVALLLGNTAAVAVLLLNTAAAAAIYFLLRFGVFNWDEFKITCQVWFVKGINFVILNFVIVIANAIFIKGFRTVVSRSLETRDASIIGLAKLAEYRDNDTGSHLNRIQICVELLAKELARLPGYSRYITPEYIKDLKISSILHDIGKVGVQDAILLKPGALTKEEFELIKQHPEIGGNVISEIEKNINGRSLYSLGKEIALHHHERWDGTGYPAGLRGEEIPLSARIIALADVYDALVSKRPYKEKIPHDKVLEMIADSSGSHFDPQIVNAFIKISIKLNEINSRNQ